MRWAGSLQAVNVQRSFLGAMMEGGGGGGGVGMRGEEKEGGDGELGGEMEWLDGWMAGWLDELDGMGWDELFVGEGVEKPGEGCGCSYRRELRENNGIVLLFVNRACCRIKEIKKWFGGFY